MLVFDKTGTITGARQRSPNIIPAAGNGADEVLRPGGTSAELAKHPLGKALVNRARKQGLELTEPEISPPSPAWHGGGREAKPAGGQPPRLMSENGIEVGEIGGGTGPAGRGGQTAMLVGARGKVQGIVAVADTLKDDSVRPLRTSRTWVCRRP